MDVFARPQSTSQFQRQESEPAELIGSCYIMPKHFTSTSGHIKEAIISSTKFEVIGEVSMDCLVVHPIKDSSCDFAMTLSKHWQPHWKGLDVGHRGLGNSYTKLDQ